jgi:hypothetical protein
MMGASAAVDRLDIALAELAHDGAALRLRLGQALEVVARRAHYFALGFSSLSAYALERCERSVRWLEGARCLARRLEVLPELRAAVAAGTISWSQAELVVRVARAEDEESWLETARGHTVRELRLIVRGAEQRLAEQRLAEQRLAEQRSTAHTSVAHTPAEPADAGAPEDSAAEAASESENDEKICTLTCTVDREEAWLFESTRALLEQLGTRGSNAQVEALLAEGQDTLLGALPSGVIDPDRLEQTDVAQRRWQEQLRRWQNEAEARCEGRIRSARSESARVVGPVSDEAACGCSSLAELNVTELDARVRSLSLALARQELELSRRILGFHRADGWRRLGYATESQYVRERLGLSRSSFLARRALALRLEALPAVAKALGGAQIGVEAASQLARVATPRTQAAWVERARQRTIKHLREEVAAALTAVRLSGDADCPPPAESELEAYAELERAVVSGEVCRERSGRCPEPARCALGRLEAGSESRRAWLVMLASLAAWLEGGLQMSAARGEPVQAGAPRGRAGLTAARVELRLRVSREIHAWWRGLEAQARPWLAHGMSWLKFLCLAFWRAWQHLVGAKVAYGGIYWRDRYRCRSPVCSRRDVTPHHLWFRSAGGGDEPENVAAVCSWCHLFGIHGGCIRAGGSAERIHWELGPRAQPCLVVDGRERVV